MPTRPCFVNVRGDGHPAGGAAGGNTDDSHCCHFSCCAAAAAARGPVEERLQRRHAHAHAVHRARHHDAGCGFLDDGHDPAALRHVVDGLHRTAEQVAPRVRDAQRLADLRVRHAERLSEDLPVRQRAAFGRDRRPSARTPPDTSPAKCCEVATQHAEVGGPAAARCLSIWPSQSSVLANRLCTTRTRHEPPLLASTVHSVATGGMPGDPRPGPRRTRRTRRFVLR
jgi:hypothetical protein